MITTQVLLCGWQRPSSYGWTVSKVVGAGPQSSCLRGLACRLQVPCWVGLLLGKAFSKAQLRLLQVCWWTGLAPQSGSHFGGAAWVGGSGVEGPQGNARVGCMVLTSLMERDRHSAH